MITGEEIKAAAMRLYGSRGWQTKLALALHVDTSTVRRWTTGQIPVPGPAAAAVQCFERES